MVEWMKLAKINKSKLNVKLTTTHLLSKKFWAICSSINTSTFMLNKTCIWLGTHTCNPFIQSWVNHKTLLKETNVYVQIIVYKICQKYKKISRITCTVINVIKFHEEFHALYF